MTWVQAHQCVSAVREILQETTASRATATGLGMCAISAPLAGLAQRVTRVLVLLSAPGVMMILRESAEGMARVKVQALPEQGTVLGRVNAQVTDLTQQPTVPHAVTGTGAKPA